MKLLSHVVENISHCLFFTICHMSHRIGSNKCYGHLPLGSIVCYYMLITKTYCTDFSNHAYNTIDIYTFDNRDPYHFWMDGRTGTARLLEIMFFVLLFFMILDQVQQRLIKYSVFDIRRTCAHTHIHTHYLFTEVDYRTFFVDQWTHHHWFFV